MRFAALLLLCSCAAAPHVGLPPLTWRSPWRVGDTFRIVRKIEYHISSEALGMKEERGLSIDGEERYCFHARVVGEEAKGVGVDVTVDPPVDKAFDHPYHLTMDGRAMMVDWVGRLDATQTLGAVGGGERYGVTTGLLREFPDGPIECGRTWNFINSVVLAHCNFAEFEMACTLETTKDGYVVSADVLLKPEPGVELDWNLRHLGTGTWHLSADLRRIRGALSFEIRNLEAKSILRWSEEVEVAPETR